MSLKPTEQNSVEFPHSQFPAIPALCSSRGRMEREILSLGSPGRIPCALWPLPGWKTQGTWNVVALGLDTCREVSVLWDGVAVIIQGWEFCWNLCVPRHQHRGQHCGGKTGNSFQIKSLKEQKTSLEEQLQRHGMQRGLVKSGFDAGLWNNSSRWGCCLFPAGNGMEIIWAHLLSAPFQLCLKLHLRAAAPHDCQGMSFP